MALEQGLPPIVVVSPDQLHARQLAAPDQGHQLLLVIAAHLIARLDVVDPGRGSSGGQHLDRDRGRGARRRRRRFGSRPGSGAAGEPGQARSHLVRLREAALGILLEAARDQRFQSTRDVGPQAAERLRVALDHRRYHLCRRVAAECGTAGGHLVEDQAEGELVGPVVHRASARLLG